MSCSGQFVTSENVMVRWTNGCNGAENHIHQLVFEPTVSSGTFVLVINGNITAPITFSPTIGTLVSNIQAAINALSMSGYTFVVSGTVVTNVLITVTEDKFIAIYPTLINLIGAPKGSRGLKGYVVQQGAEEYVLEAALTSADLTITGETSDMTSIDSFEASSDIVAQSAGGSLNFYDAGEEWLIALRGGAYRGGAVGRLEVYEEGKVDGSNYFIAEALITDLSITNPDHDKNTITLSFERLGDWVVSPDTTYKA